MAASTTELPNGFAVQRAMPSKRNTDMPNVPPISLRFFRRIRRNAYAATAVVHLINACVVGISKGNKGKNPWFRTEYSGSLSQAAKYERSRNKHTRSQNINCYIFVLIVNRWSLTEIVASLLVIKLFVSKSSVVSRIHSFRPPLFS